MSKNRGKNPDEKVLRMLCGKAAGMCQFPGCNERLFYDQVTTAEFISSNVAHIVASSPKGVRGDEKLSHELSDKIENLMLMCYKHHKLIDNEKTGALEYPVEHLKEMKRNHEEHLDSLCKYFEIPVTELLFLVSPIRGKEVAVDVKLAGKAVLPEKQPATPYGHYKKISSKYKYGSQEFWDELTSRLAEVFYEIKNILSIKPQTHFSVFPLAPMPLIAKFGEITSDKIPVDVFQKTRVPDTWNWQSQEKTNSFSKKKDICSEGKTIAIIISLTAEISIERVTAAITPNIVYTLSAEKKGVDCIKSIVDLSLFWYEYQQLLDEITKEYGKNACVNLFMAMPISAAFEVGRRHMPAVHPSIKVFDEDEEKFKYALTIGG